MRHTDGSWRWCETFWTATIQQDVRYKIAVGRDITERKQLEAQLLQANKMESIGRLAGGVAHDFNNLLTVIMGSAELALDALSPDDPACGDVRAIQKTAGRAANLTRQLLAFARKQIIEPDLINLNDLLPDMDRLLRRLIGEDITLVYYPRRTWVSSKSTPARSSRCWSTSPSTPVTRCRTVASSRSKLGT